MCLESVGGQKRSARKILVGRQTSQITAGGAGANQLNASACGARRLVDLWRPTYNQQGSDPIAEKANYRPHLW